MKKMIILILILFAMNMFGEELFFDDFEAGLVNWNSIINSGAGEWIVYSQPYPNAYNMPPTSSGNVCSADADEAGSGTTTDCTIELSAPLNLTTYENIVLEFDNDFNAIDSDDYCYVDVSVDGGSSWVNVLEFAGIDVTATHEVVDISLLANMQSSVLIRFHSIQPGWDWWWTIDNVEVTGDLAITYDNDLAAQNIYGNTIINAGNSENYEISIKNIGNNPQDNYTVTLYKDNAIELNSIDISQTIAPDETVVHNLVWNVPANEPAGNVNIYGEVTLAGDENTANDQTNIMSVQIYPPGIIEVSVGSGTENNNRTPVCFQYKNSLTEIIYFSEELDVSEGMITALTYYNNFTTNLINKPTAIWVGETTQTNLTDGWIPSTSLTEVFNGTVTYPSGTNSVTIEFTTPYVYNGNNLVVMAHRPMDTSGYGTSDYFLHDTTPEHIDRTRYERDDVILLDPANPPEVSYSNETFANTTFTFFQGAMGEVEGYVYDDDDIPLEGASVTIEETQTVTYSNDQGYYHFGNVVAGDYNFTANLMGYSPQTLTGEVIEEEITEVDFNLIPLGAVSVYGHVVGSDIPEVGLEAAIVELTGFENYQTETDANGDFIFESVYTNITYDIQISYEGYDNYNSEVSVGNTSLDLETLTLNEIAYPPGNVQAVQNFEGTQVDLLWSPPGQGGGEFRYDDGNIDFQTGYNSTPPNAVFGAVHPYIAVIQEMHWYLSSTYEVHNQVKLYIFGLDEDDNPNSADVLYESGYIDNTDDEWNIHVLETPIEAFEGFFIGLSTPNQYTSIGMDDGVGEPWEFQSGTQFSIENWTSGGSWTDIGSYGPNYERNLLIRAYGINMGNTMISENNSQNKMSDNNYVKRTLESYNVYRFYDYQHNNPSSWQLIAESIIDTAYVDLDWDNIPNGTYQFAIRSVYTNGVTSIPAFSALIEKTSAASDESVVVQNQLFANYPNPFNPQTMITFNIARNTTKVELVIYNVKGQFVRSYVNRELEPGKYTMIWEGTDENNRPVTSGVYFYQLTTDNEIIGTNRMLLLK
ncbi:MAG: carboxypeptidase regulatory-like domain-containing protein [Candidatus Cloacimonetes bacterium]|nr:carboxypeptidase regulatory-like domain-containing protein [Candidatus Cloacimonadota bacterium]